MGKYDLRADLLSSGTGHEYHEGTRVAGTVAARFCSFGMVSSVKWFTCYVVVEEGQMRLYSDEQHFRSSPEDPVWKEYFSHHHQASSIKRKQYSQNSQGVVELSCFYLQVENGAFAPTKKIKLGCVSQSLAETFVRTVNAMCR